jgi:hypothetical protein
LLAWGCREISNDVFGLFDDFTKPKIVCELFAYAAFFFWIFGEVPAEGLVEEVAMEVEGGFD